MAHTRLQQPTQAIRIIGGSTDPGFAETALAPVSGLTVTSNPNATSGASTSYATTILNPLGQPQPDGTVTWTSNGTVLGQSTVSSGSTSFTATFNEAAQYAVVASYGGQQEPGTATFTQTGVSTRAGGSGPFPMSAPQL